ncbi:unnamed protein product [Phyllotreta striolata]|uniref:Phosphatidylethanolamine-binding protein n=1 Tax=Phyllotreta striolata TaxID=444603 RepID=A0A9N9XML0_PHYSR|nr:unnamed protein product [Phyllotreta striolata]
MSSIRVLFLTCFIAMVLAEESSRPSVSVSSVRPTIRAFSTTIRLVPDQKAGYPEKLMLQAAGALTDDSKRDASTMKLNEEVKTDEKQLGNPFPRATIGEPNAELTPIEAFKQNKIVPDVCPDGPEKALEVIYPSAKEVKFGNELTPKQVLTAPTVKYDADANAFYTLIMTDPDAPSRLNPKAREWQHWLVVNIPGNDISKGDTLSQYVGSAPPKGSGLHRYVFLLFKQPEKVQFHETLHNANDGNRGKFNTNSFAAKYNLGAPIAGNFFGAQYDDTVPATHKRLGF